MPNNLVFNNVASQLAVQLYGQYNGTSITVKTDSDGNLITVSQPTFTESTTTITGIATTTVTAMTQDTSLVKELSFYIVNQTANTCTAWLQVSPSTSETFYMDDPTGTTAIGPNSMTVLTPYLFLHYTRLLLLGSAGADSTTATVYYNAQSA